MSFTWVSFLYLKNVVSIFIRIWSQGIGFRPRFIRIPYATIEEETKERFSRFQYNSFLHARVVQ